MHLPHSARGNTVERALATMAAALRRVVFGLAGLLVMAFTLLAGLVIGGALLVVALVARHRLQRSLRFAWQRAGTFRPATATPRSSRAAPGAGEVVDVEVREICG